MAQCSKHQLTRSRTRCSPPTSPPLNAIRRIVRSKRRLTARDRIIAYPSQLCQIVGYVTDQGGLALDRRVLKVSEKLPKTKVVFASLSKYRRLT